MTFGGVSDNLCQRGLACARGPQRMMEEKSLSASMARRRSLPSPTICSCPMYSSSVRGRIRAASGASDFRRSFMAWSKRSLDMSVIIANYVFAGRAEWRLLIGTESIIRTERGDVTYFTISCDIHP